MARVNSLYIASVYAHRLCPRQSADMRRHNRGGLNVLHSVYVIADFRRDRPVFTSSSTSEGERAFDRAPERVKTLSIDPTLCHWAPNAIILFGSLLNEDATSVGDV